MPFGPENGPGGIAHRSDFPSCRSPPTEDGVVRKRGISFPAGTFPSLVSPAQRSKGRRECVGVEPTWERIGAPPQRF